MAAPEPVLRLHLGAHKTASTHVQTRLAAMRDALAADDRAFLPLRALRDMRLRTLARRDPRAWFGPSGLAWAVRARLAPHLPDGARTLILSDEDFLGFADEALAAPSYPAAERRLRPLRALAAGRPTRLFLAVRSWDGYAPSAYAQLLRSAHRPGGFDAIRRRMMREPPDWAGLAARLLRLFPAADLVVWRYEDYRLNERAILAEIIGADPGPAPDLPAPGHTRGASAPAIAAAEALDPALPVETRRARVAAIFADPAHAGAPFAPFDVEERAALQALYARQLQTIASMPRARLLDFRTDGREEPRCADPC